MKFIIFYKGPTTPPNASHKGWPSWFDSIGKALVDYGSPIAKGVTLHDDGSTTDSKTNYNGYSVIEAKDMGKAVEIVKSHPYLANGKEYSIEIFKKG